jgi:MFS family permease
MSQEMTSTSTAVSDGGQPVVETAAPPGEPAPVRAAPPGEPAPVRQRGGLLRHRDFRLLWAGQTTSRLGSAVTGIALPLVAVSTLDAGPFAMGLLTAMGWVPTLLIGLPAGAWVDRRSRRRVMMSCNVWAMLLILSVPVLAWLGVLSIPYLLVVALGGGVSSVFFAPAYQAFLPTVVAKKDLSEANAKMAGSGQAAFIGGSGLGGLIAQVFGPLLGLVVDSTSYLVSMLCLGAIRTTEPGQDRARRRNTTIRQDVVEGIRFLAGDPYLRIIALCASLENLFLVGAHALLIVFLVRTVGIPPAEVGVLMVADSIGGLAGAVISRRISRRIGTARALLVISIGTAPIGLLIPLTSKGAGALLFMVGLGVPAAGMVACAVITSSFRQAYCPQEMQGRVTNTAMVLVYGSMPIGALVAGVLGAQIGVRPALWVMLGALAAAKFLRLIGPIKRHRDLPTERLATV